jgi:tryptophan synthase alpha chain
MEQTMNAIEAMFHRLRSEKLRAFIPFVTAGDPDLAMTAALVEELVRRGASLVELGFPYSDPIADGSVIQASYTRALERRIQLADVFACARRLTDSPVLSRLAVPLVGMVSYSLVHRRGAERFLDNAKDAGLSGAIVPDLPFDEADVLASQAAARDFKLIQLVTPTTPPDRAVHIAGLSTGFLYCVSVTGITGERDRLPDELLGQLAWLRRHTNLPICVGFGISRPDQVHMLRDHVDGIIVGSALVRRFEQAAALPADQVIRDVGALAAELANALNPPAA